MTYKPRRSKASICKERSARSRQGLLLQIGSTRLSCQARLNIAEDPRQRSGRRYARHRLRHSNGTEALCLMHQRRIAHGGAETGGKIRGQGGANLEQAFRADCRSKQKPGGVMPFRLLRMFCGITPEHEYLFYKYRTIRQCYSAETASL